MGIEGLLDIQLTTTDNKVNDVVIRSSRPVYASQVFHGKSVSESLAMLPLLFSVCGVAQSCAGIRACEQALGIDVPRYIERIRDKLVKMESLREHLWRILLDWPALLERLLPDKQSLQQHSHTQEMSAIIKHQQTYRQLLTCGSNPFLLAADIAPVNTTDCQPLKLLNQLLEKCIFAITTVKWLEIDSIEQLYQWFDSSNTIAAGLLKKIQQNQWQNSGRNTIKGLFSSSSEAVDIDTIATHFEKENFVKLPQWQNKCYETSSLTRIDSPLLRQLYAQWGNGLMTRLVARLTEMALIINDLQDAAKDTLQTYHQCQNNRLNEGFGVVNAARGLLMHHVSIDAHQIKSYQILAPTEWNFHPQGVVSQSLACLSGDGEKIKNQAELIINAIDPCVAYNLRLDER